MAYLYLAAAIVLEVIATTFLKASDGFAKLLPGMMATFGYGGAFFFLSLALKTLPVGVAYAIWAGAGIALAALVAALVFKQIPDMPAIIGMALIMSGVLVINIFSKMG